MSDPAASDRSPDSEAASGQKLGYGSFCFVLNLFDYEGTLPVRISDDIYFDRATPKQIEAVKTLLIKLKAPYSADLPYEHRVEISFPSDGKTVWSETRLPEEDWLYWAVNFKGQNVQVSNVGHAMSLLENDLEFGLTIFGDDETFKGAGGVLFDLERLLSYQTKHFGFSRPRSTVRESDIVEVARLYGMIESLDRSNSFMYDSIRRLQSTKSMGISYDMSTIGLFSILESLLFRPVRDTDTGSSIRHQMRHKIHLMTRFFRRPLDYSKYFKPANEDKILALLYDFRSAIVHSGHADMVKTFQLLKSKDDVYNFMLELVKLLIISGLEDPEFLADLQAC